MAFFGPGSRVPEGTSAGTPSRSPGSNPPRKRYYWPKMRKEVDIYVKSCVNCGRVTQPTKYLRLPLKHVIAHDFNDILLIDFLIP